jgi:NarL family two-component system sensor histidine kinase LiaS
MDKLFARLRASFRRLRWKLTLSYTGVTIGALLVVVLLLAILFFSFVLLPNDNLAPDYWIETLRSGKLIIMLEEALAQSPPDATAIKFLVNNVDTTLSINDFFRLGDLRLSVRTTAQFEAAVVDAEGALLSATAGELAAATGNSQLYRVRGLPEMQGPLEAALLGEDDPQRLSAVRESDSALVIAAPVFRGRSEEVLGAIVVVLKSLPVQQAAPRYVTRVIAGSLLLFTLAAGVVGAIFGSLTARGLARRFDRLSQAADAWSQGSFTELVDDESGDELGQLSRRMNRMAQQLEELLKEHQRIAVFEERNRLARDLHDSVKQQAFAASAQLGATAALFEKDPAAARDHLAEATKLLDDARRELNDLILQLRPVALENGDLTDALREYAVEWAHQTDIAVDVQVQRAGRLSLEVAHALFRIAQEALSNIARHSHARRVVLTLVSGPDGATLTISDDGQGFDPDDSPAGLGLRSMRERAESLGGALTVDSSPGAGTRISATVADG